MQEYDRDTILEWAEMDRDYLVHIGYCDTDTGIFAGICMNSDWHQGTVIPVYTARRLAAQIMLECDTVEAIQQTAHQMHDRAS